MTSPRHINDETGLGHPAATDTENEAVSDEAKIGEEVVNTKSTKEGIVTELLDSQAPEMVDRNMPFWQVVRTWPYAVLWSVVLSSPMVLTGYTPSYMAYLNAMPAFTKKFGFEYDNLFIIAASWQAAIAASSMIGMIIGAPLITIAMEKYGRKIPFWGSFIFQIAFVFVQFFGESLGAILAGTLLMNIPLGAYGVLSMSYATEVAPFRLRGVVGGMYCMWVLIGPLIAVGVSNGIVSMTSDTSYRVGFAVQWAWPAILGPLLFIVPESPVWLIRQGRVVEAEASLRKLARKGHDVRPTLFFIEQIDRRDRELDEGTGFMECFRGTNLRRTVIASIVYAAMNVTGVTMVLNSAYFLQVAGVDAKTAFNLSLGIQGVIVAGSLLSLGLLAKYDRRNIYLWSQVASTIMSFIIGFLQITPNYYERTDILWAQAGIMVVWGLNFGATLAPISTTIMSEVSCLRLRPKTIAVAGIAQFIIIVVSFITYPYLINPDQGHLQGYIGFIMGGCCLLFTTWIFFCCPETNRPVHELDLLFERKVSARNFAKYDLLDTHNP
ncbi:hypothetical protein GE09DRAFT_1090899 [Coniochaeta sp. 2T2.1]|nr:hypothetical protein GE09DRAFT_1090899 [Coniochaeta sp. 2T2.1]